MHLQVGEDLHGEVRDGKVVLVPCFCPEGPYLLPEVRLPAQAAVLFPVALGDKDES
jgi:hypothetical protein